MFLVSKVDQVDSCFQVIVIQRERPVSLSSGLGHTGTHMTVLSRGIGQRVGTTLDLVQVPGGKRF